MDSSSTCLPGQNQLTNDGSTGSMMSECTDKLTAAFCHPAHRQLGRKSDGDDHFIAKDHGDADQNSVIRFNSYYPPPAASEDYNGQLWPRIAQIEDRPPSPTDLQDVVIKQMISESSCQSSANDMKEWADMNRPREPTVIDDDRSGPQISKSDHRPSKQTETQQDSMALSSDRGKPATEKDNLKANSETEKGFTKKQNLAFNFADQKPVRHKDEAPNECRPYSDLPKYHGNGRPPLQGMSDRAHEPVQMGEPCASIMQSYQASARGRRLSRVMEESESFAKREFGETKLIYMSTASSANHATNLYSLAQNTCALGNKQVTHRHNNYHQFSYSLRISQDLSNHGRFMNSKSAPAGTAERTGLAFGQFQRGAPEHGNLRLKKQTDRIIPRKLRKPKTLASTLLWPLVKIKCGYVGCMMGLAGADDLRGMAQGGTYGDSIAYFADVPLSKRDSRNHG